MTDKTQEEFEAWAKKRLFYLTPHAHLSEMYECMLAECAWQSWQHQQAVIDAKEEAIIDIKTLLGLAYAKLLLYRADYSDPLLLDQINLELMK